MSDSQRTALVSSTVVFSPVQTTAAAAAATRAIRRRIRCRSRRWHNMVDRRRARTALVSEVCARPSPFRRAATAAPPRGKPRCSAAAAACMSSEKTQEEDDDDTPRRGWPPSHASTIKFENVEGSLRPLRLPSCQRSPHLFYWHIGRLGAKPSGRLDTRCSLLYSSPVVRKIDGGGARRRASDPDPVLLGRSIMPPTQAQQPWTDGDSPAAACSSSKKVSSGAWQVEHLAIPSPSSPPPPPPFPSLPPFIVLSTPYPPSSVHLKLAL